MDISHKKHFYQGRQTHKQPTISMNKPTEEENRVNLMDISHKKHFYWDRQTHKQPNISMNKPTQGSHRRKNEPRSSQGNSRNNTQLSCNLCDAQRWGVTKTFIILNQNQKACIHVLGLMRHLLWPEDEHIFWPSSAFFVIFLIPEYKLCMTS